jgi:outer membrane receptor protein involved in Fe transport
VLSPFAGEDEPGGAEVEPERQWGYEAGVNQRVGRFLQLDVAAWYRNVRNAADPNVFAGTTIIFPNAVATGRARGLDTRLELSHGQWSGYLNAASGSVTQQGPIVGGLFLEDEVAELGDGVEFVPDHDQRIVISGGVAWVPRRSGFSISTTVRYESGTPIQREEDELDELEQRPGAELADFAAGRVRPRTVVSLVAELPIVRNGRRSIAVRASALNLFDARYAYNFGNPFSGTHFGAPRTVSAGVRVVF